mmetsp:Transcript_7422/g.33532  ORF Transcript_7422/g.33532 Transcript_7422/m.33532 type:complete len:355 (+) Transcript_7422:793-1857(+)
MNGRGVREELEGQPSGDGFVVAGADVAGGGEKRLRRFEPFRRFPQNSVAPGGRPLRLVVEPRLALHLERGHVGRRRVTLAEAHERVAGLTRSGELVLREDLCSPRRPGLDLGHHRVEPLTRWFALDLGTGLDAPLAPVVEVTHPHQVVERLGALELLAELAPADDLGEIVVAALVHVVVRGEVAVDEAHGGIPDAARDPDAALVVHDVAQPGGFGGFEPVVHGGRDVGADENADSHLTQRVLAVQDVRIPEGVGQARRPVVIALVESFSWVVIALLASHHDHVVVSELFRVEPGFGLRDGRRRRDRLLLLLLLLSVLRGGVGLGLGVGVGVCAHGRGGRDGGKLRLGFVGWIFV